MPNRKCTFSNTQYWKIAPGKNAWQWQNCLNKGFIAMGWDELGDVSNFDSSGFDARRDELITQYPEWGWSKTGVNQVWAFAQIKDGDCIIANRGKTEVLGIGTVTGSYYFEANAEKHKHRLPIRWDDLTPRLVDKSGWRRTLIELTDKEFKEISGAALAIHEDPISARPMRGLRV